MWTLKNQLQFIVCDAMRLGLVLPYDVTLYDEGNIAFMKCYNQLKLLISGGEKNPLKPQQLKFMGTSEKYTIFG